MAPRPPHLRLIPPVAPPTTAPTAADLVELLDTETRLLACAVGDHLPIELALKVAELRARHAELAGQ